MLLLSWGPGQSFSRMQFRACTSGGVGRHVRLMILTSCIPGSSVEVGTMRLAVRPTTFVSQTNRSGLQKQPASQHTSVTCMERNMKQMVHHNFQSYTTKKRHASFADFEDETRWWFRHGTYAFPVGGVNMLAFWCQCITITKATRMRSVWTLRRK